MSGKKLGLSEKLGGWQYYNHAALPKCKPHETPDLTVFQVHNLWSKGVFKKALFAKYTTNWDCDEETGWYWVIKDTPICLENLKSKHRYEIKKGIANFEVKPIEPCNYPDELYEIAVDTLKTYPSAYQNIPSKEQFVKMLPTWEFTFGAFSKENERLCGYIIMVERDEVLYYSEQRVLQSCEKQYINSALVFGMLDYYKERIEAGAYIVDGEKNINHITNHQEYLCSKMGFRKANCKLNIVYRPGIRVIVNILWSFRKVIKKYDLRLPLIHSLNGVMKLEAVIRGIEY